MIAVPQGPTVITSLGDHDYAKCVLHNLFCVVTGVYQCGLKPEFGAAVRAARTRLSDRSRRRGAGARPGGVPLSARSRGRLAGSCTGGGVGGAA